MAEKFADRIVKLKDGKIIEIMELKRNEEGNITERNIKYVDKTNFNQEVINKLKENGNSK